MLNRRHSVQDNRALSQASSQAAKDGIPLLVLFVISPQDYVAHDRSARRVDFTLRNLSVLKVCLQTLLVHYRHLIWHDRAHWQRWGFLCTPSYIL